MISSVLISAFVLVSRTVVLWFAKLFFSLGSGSVGTDFYITGDYSRDTWLTFLGEIADGGVAVSLVYADAGSCLSHQTPSPAHDFVTNMS